MIYLVVFLLLLYGAYIFDYKNVPCSSIIYKRLEVVSILFLIFVPGLSFRIGVDTPGYMEDYQSMVPLNELSWKFIQNQGQEFLWIVFYSTCKTISDNYAFMHIIQCSILHLSLYYFIKNLSDKHFYVWLFYFTGIWVHMCFGALRESLAFSFFLIALLKLLKSGSYKAYVIWALPALLFHKFAFIPVLLTPAFFVFRKRKLLAIFLSAITITYLAVNIKSLISTMVGIGIDNADVVDFYVEANTVGDTQMSVVGILSYIIRLVIPSFIIIYLQGQNKYSFLKNAQILLILIAILGLIASFVSDFRRCYYYFLPFIGVCISSILDDKRKGKLCLRKQKIPYYLLIVVVTYTIYANISSFWRPTVLEYRPRVNYNVFYFPYYTVFTEETDPLREAIAQ